MVRLQKYMADCGVASRRKSEEMISEGRVRVNGRPVLRMGVTVDAQKDVVTVDGKRIGMAKTHRYIAYYKPSCVVTTLSDEKGRECVGNFLKKFKERLYPVGRLDYLSEGLLLLTDDGVFANNVTHPRHELKKHYYVVADGPINDERAKQLRAGIILDGKKTAPAALNIIESGEKRSTAHMQISEGRNRQVRRMFESVGLNVVFLKRERIGNVSLGDLKPGGWRDLTPVELRDMNNLIKK